MGKPVKDHRRNPPLKLTAKQIEAGKSRRGGYTNKQLQRWGINCPPTQGWKDRLLRGEVQDPPRKWNRDSSHIQHVTVVETSASGRRGDVSASLVERQNDQWSITIDGTQVAVVRGKRQAKVTYDALVRDAMGASRPSSKPAKKTTPSSTNNDDAFRLDAAYRGMMQE